MVMDLETEARKDCAGEDQQQFNRPTEVSREPREVENSESAV
jgi:hypothetical protein